MTSGTPISPAATTLTEVTTAARRTPSRTPLRRWREGTEPLRERNDANRLLPLARARRAYHRGGLRARRAIGPRAPAGADQERHRAAVQPRADERLRRVDRLSPRAVARHPGR